MSESLHFQFYSRQRYIGIEMLEKSICTFAKTQSRMFLSVAQGNLHQKHMIICK